MKSDIANWNDTDSRIKKLRDASVSPNRLGLARWANFPDKEPAKRKCHYVKCIFPNKSGISWRLDKNKRPYVGARRRRHGRSNSAIRLISRLGDHRRGADVINPANTAYRARRRRKYIFTQIFHYEARSRRDSTFCDANPFISTFVSGLGGCDEENYDININVIRLTRAVARG